MLYPSFILLNSWIYLNYCQGNNNIKKFIQLESGIDLNHILEIETVESRLINHSPLQNDDESLASWTQITKYPMATLKRLEKLSKCEQPDSQFLKDLKIGEKLYERSKDDRVTKHSVGIAHFESDSDSQNSRGRNLQSSNLPNTDICSTNNILDHSFKMSQKNWAEIDYDEEIEKVKYTLKLFVSYFSKIDDGFDEILENSKGINDHWDIVSFLICLVTPDFFRNRLIECLFAGYGDVGGQLSDEEEKEIKGKEKIIQYLKTGRSEITLDSIFEYFVEDMRFVTDTSQVDHFKKKIKECLNNILAKVCVENSDELFKKMASDRLKLLVGQRAKYYLNDNFLKTQGDLSLWFFNPKLIDKSIDGILNLDSISIVAHVFDNLQDKLSPSLSSESNTSANSLSFGQTLMNLLKDAVKSENFIDTIGILGVILNHLCYFVNDTFLSYDDVLNEFKKIHNEKSVLLNVLKIRNILVQIIIISIVYEKDDKKIENWLEFSREINLDLEVESSVFIHHLSIFSDCSILDDPNVFNDKLKRLIEIFCTNFNHKKYLPIFFKGFLSQFKHRKEKNLVFKTFAKKSFDLLKKLAKSLSISWSEMFSSSYEILDGMFASESRDCMSTLFQILNEEHDIKKTLYVYMLSNECKSFPFLAEMLLMDDGGVSGRDSGSSSSSSIIPPPHVEGNTDDCSQMTNDPSDSWKDVKVLIQNTAQSLKLGIVTKQFIEKQFQ